ncbi:hypothetical protein IQ265_12900 [Nodosilinea sp. LEGE 06152]|uniref:hypothetical protein n=1 Tax=Nodosilinea sp. LEGE 06152 TaxID=2777966 RepID=UPI0018815237|nr:hypothetical protein [Nodosilinea sp. LEGE 06152]MBE9157715.1 hypothetical protein [Nodosilinea sp. LEGE 06152]
MARFLTPVLLLLLPLASCRLLASPNSSAARPSADVVESAQTAADTLVVPGRRVGPVTAETSRAELAARYGEAALEDASISVGEGTTAAGTVVTPGPDQQFAVVWQDVSQTRPQLIRDFGPAWQTPEGLGIGIPYSEVEAILGNFQLYGFAWDYSGTVILEGSQLDQYDGYLLLRLEPAATAIEQHPEAYQAVMGDQLFASDDPSLDRLEPSISEMIVYFDALP